MHFEAVDSGFFFFFMDGVIVKHDYSKIITYQMFLKLIEINRCSVRVKLILFSYLELGRKQKQQK